MKCDPLQVQGYPRRFFGRLFSSRKVHFPAPFHVCGAPIGRPVMRIALSAFAILAVYPRFETLRPVESCADCSDHLTKRSFLRSFIRAGIGLPSKCNIIPSTTEGCPFSGTIPTIFEAIHPAFLSRWVICQSYRTPLAKTGAAITIPNNAISIGFINLFMRLPLSKFILAYQVKYNLDFSRCDQSTQPLFTKVVLIKEHLGHHWLKVFGKIQPWTQIALQLSANRKCTGRWTGNTQFGKFQRPPSKMPPQPVPSVYGGTCQP